MFKESGAVNHRFPQFRIRIVLDIRYLSKRYSLVQTSVQYSIKAHFMKFRGFKIAIIFINLKLLNQQNPKDLTYLTTVKLNPNLICWVCTTTIHPLPQWVRVHPAKKYSPSQSDEHGYAPVLT